MHPKLKMLKEVLRQMQCAMAEGDGDSAEAGEEAMEHLADVGEEKKVAAEADEDDVDLDTEKKEFMRHGKKLPSGGKGSGRIMARAAVPSSGSKKPEMKKMKYG